MLIGDGEVALVHRTRRRIRLRLTVLGLLVLIAFSALALYVYRTYSVQPIERPMIVVRYRELSPVADGVIGEKEYGPGVTITWTADNTLAAFEHVIGDSTSNKPPGDLSISLQTAYTNTSLFFAFRVKDQFVDAQKTDQPPATFNDGVEVFIDGDRVSNDFGQGPIGSGPYPRTGTEEGFQLLADAAGNQYTQSTTFTNADWKTAVKRTDDGYVIEMEVPLKLIDTADGPPFAPAGPGSVLNFALAVTDYDAEVSHQMSYAYLRTLKSNMSPWIGKENAWKFALKLQPKRSLFSW
jgi:Carbohydrate family 9 binding domain-like